ncbi:branched-chain amino acid aminotransferase II [Aureobasidium sp. EXF-8845]|nr:branched-chain amino acid aminotransferase II [Aureobasidium sp. EXF-8845]KAI4857631.1 branched-chain amino acid aminotransferase II [Aureobasidium sp. EXF-8846]
MIQASWNCDSGWEPPILKPSEPLQIQPTASVLHYAIECFEGLKLYRGYDGRLRLFRVAKNCERMRMSAARVTLPDFDAKELEKMILALCAQDGPRWLPRDHVGQFLYIRPTLISTDPALGVRTPREALLYVVLVCFGDNSSIVPASPGLRLAQDLSGLKLRTSALDSIRAWPGGFGYAKIGANYGPSLVAQRKTQAAGYHQTLWLFGNQCVVTEAGGSNFFVVWRDAESGRLQLVTAPLEDGIILAGITRASIIELAQYRLDASCEGLEAVDVVERQYTMDDVSKAFREGRLVEAFVCGTAYFVTPEGRNESRYARKIRSWLAEVMWGDDRHGNWVLNVDEEVES